MQEELEKGAETLREFMQSQTREADIGWFGGLGNTGPSQGPEEGTKYIFLPAYVTNDVTTVF